MCDESIFFNMLTLKAVVAVCTVVGLALGNPSDLSCEDPRLSDGEKIMHLTVRNPNQARIHEATCVFSCSCFFLLPLQCVISHCLIDPTTTIQPL